MLGRADRPHYNTHLYVRMFENPALDTIPMEARKDDPKLDITPYILPITRREPNLPPAYRWGKRVHKQIGAPWILVKDVNSKYFPHRKFFMLKQKIATDTIKFLIPAYKHMPPQYLIKIVSDRWTRQVSLATCCCMRRTLCPPNS